MPTSTPVHRIGEQVLNAVAEIGGLAQFSASPCPGCSPGAAQVVGPGPELLRDRRPERPVVAITGTFIGMVLAVQAYSQFEMMGLATRMGSVINISLVKELGPVLAATMLAGRVGSSMAAELGTMRVTEQIDALSALGTNPINYLVVPRFLACVLLIPLLTLMADFMGVIGGAVVSTQLHEGRLVLLLVSLPAVRRGARPAGRGLQELLLRLGDRPDQLPPRVPLQGRRRGGGQGGDRGVRLTRSSRSWSSTSSSASSGTPFTTRSGPTRRASYERPDPRRNRRAEPDRTGRG